MKKLWKRLTGLVLALVLVLTMASSTVLANAATTNVFVASDRHAKSSYLNGVLTAAKEGTSGTISYAILAGDLVDNTDSYKLSTVQTEITDVLGTGTKVYFTYGSHDAGADTSGTNGFLEGAVDCGTFYLYGIHYNSMINASTAQTASAAFTSWVAGADTSKPILIVSHVPLHKRRGDNNGATYWMKAINEAAETHTIAFFWGHNHTGETSADTALYYAPVGTMITAQGDSEATQIRFQYANAGYIKNGYGSVVTITDNQISIKRYYMSSTTTHTHSYGNPTWTWSGNTSATASFACTSGDDTQTVTAVISSVTTAATCTTEGSTTYTATASYGGTTYTDSRSTTIAATGHSWDAGVVTKASTEYEEGVKTYTCSVCGQTKTESIEKAAAHTHDYSTYKNIYTPTEVDKVSTCSICGATQTTVNTGVTTIAKGTDKVWYYYKNGVVATNYTGVAKRKANGTWWYVKKGKVVFTYTGLAKNPTNNTWWYCKKGQVIFTYTGLAKNPGNGNWYYCKKGKVDFTYTGIVTYKNSRYYVKKGKMQSTFTGTVKINGKSYNIVKGKVK